MALDYDTLTAVDPFRFYGFGFEDSQPFLENAADVLGDAERVVTGGHAWTGEGQPQAALVMRTNLLGLRAAKLQMRAGAAAMDALSTAVRTAQDEQVVEKMGAVVYGSDSYLTVDSSGVMSVYRPSFGDTSPGAEEHRINRSHRNEPAGTRRPDQTGVHRERQWRGARVQPGGARRRCREPGPGELLEEGTQPK